MPEPTGNEARISRGSSVCLRKSPAEVAEWVPILRPTFQQRLAKLGGSLLLPPLTPQGKCSSASSRKRAVSANVKTLAMLELAASVPSANASAHNILAPNPQSTARRRTPAERLQAMVGTERSCKSMAFARQCSISTSPSNRQPAPSSDRAGVPLDGGLGRQALRRPVLDD